MRYWKFSQKTKLKQKLFADSEKEVENFFQDGVDVPNFGGMSGSEDRGGGDNSIQFISIGRVGDKSFKE